MILLAAGRAIFNLPKSWRFFIMAFTSFALASMQFIFTSFAVKSGDGNVNIYGISLSASLAVCNIVQFILNSLHSILSKKINFALI